MRNKLPMIGIRLVKEPPLYSEDQIDSPDAAVKVVGGLIKDADREVMCVICLQTDLRPICAEVVSIGAINAAVAHPRELLKGVILANAAAIMLVHNHPSGCLTPSQEDAALTERMREICDLLGIALVDHIIVGRNGDSYSFARAGVLAGNIIRRPIVAEGGQHGHLAVHFPPATIC